MSDASLNRRDIFAALAVLIDTLTEVVTVVRTYTEVDIKQYNEASFPVVVITEPLEDVDQELTSHRQMMRLATSIRVYFISWAATPTATYETLVKKIRNLIGNNFRVSETAVATWVTSVGALTGNMPLYYFDIGLKMLYYLDQVDA